MITKVPNIPRGANIAAIGATVGMAVGRIGDIINGEHAAKSTDLPWGIVYTDPNSPSFIRFGAAAEPQHPAVAYEMIGDLIIFVALLFVYFASRELASRSSRGCSCMACSASSVSSCAWTTKWSWAADCTIDCSRRYPHRARWHHLLDENSARERAPCRPPPA